MRNKSYKIDQNADHSGKRRKDRRSEMRTLYIFLIFILVYSVAAGDAKVQFLIGDVRMKEQVRQEDWNPLRLKQIVKERSVVRTGAESRLDLVFEDGSTVRLMDYSMLQVATVARKNEKKSDVFALLGKFYFNIKKQLSGQFRIKSPTSVAAIRGTEFMLNNTKSKSELWVKSGQVAFSDKVTKAEVIVQAGYKSVVYEGEMASQPVPLSSAEKRTIDEIENPQTEKPTPILQIQKTDPPKYENGDASPQPEIQEERDVPTPPPPSEEGFGMGLSIGAVTIDNQIYNQIGLRPEFSIGKFGMALDLTLYIDEDGNIREDNWDSFDDIIEKIYYVRWGHKGDPFYTKLGAIDNYRLGYGILMRHYSNTIEYPTVIRTGLELGFQGDRFGADIMVNDFKELGKPGGLYAARLTFRIIGGLTLGANVVYDRNQYASLRDRDDDGVPNIVDDFPGDDNYAKDTDGDGVPDQLDPDRDGDGYTDNPPEDSLHLYNDNDFDPANLKADPFNIKTARDKEQIAFSVDLGLPIVQTKYLELTLYSQAAKFGYSGGWGYTPLGFISKFAFINFYGEFRMFEEKFIPEYFNLTYELERAVFVKDENDSTFISTKRETLQGINERLKGFMVGADFNLWNVMVFGAEYQRMRNSHLKMNTFRAGLDLNTSFVPKVSMAGAYYYQQNADKLFVRGEGTVLGYRIGYDISESAALVFDYRVTYRDRNGDGEIKGSNESIRTTNIQTVFRF
jgi:hypothetical protein